MIFDASVPNAARIYDFFLGGKDNYQADRDAAGDPVARTGDVQSPDGFHRADALVQPRLYFVADISAHGRGYAVRGTVR